MTLLILEALLAGVLLVFIVWWTMFSGRPNGELPQQVEPGQRNGGAQGDEARAAAANQADGKASGNTGDGANSIALNATAEVQAEPGVPQRLGARPGP